MEQQPPQAGGGVDMDMDSVAAAAAGDDSSDGRENQEPCRMHGGARHHTHLKRLLSVVYSDHRKKTSAW
jgi:hypothetical protein